MGWDQLLRMLVVFGVAHPTEVSAEASIGVCTMFVTLVTVGVGCCRRLHSYIHKTYLLKCQMWVKCGAASDNSTCFTHCVLCRRYVLPTALPQLATRRAGVPEQWLEGVLQQATTRLRLHLAPRQRRALAARDAVELLQLMALDSNAQAAAAAEAAAADLPGRQSGAEAWRVARGETGVCVCLCNT